MRRWRSPSGTPRPSPASSSTVSWAPTCAPAARSPVTGRRPPLFRKRTASMSPLLPTITDPSQLKTLAPAQLQQLAAEIRAELLQNLSRTGGHLAPNLGVVELTLALHSVLDSPKDKIIWDVGHQSYVHKML